MIYSTIFRISGTNLFIKNIEFRVKSEKNRKNLFIICLEINISPIFLFHQNFIATGICPPLNSTTVNILCSYQGNEVSCTDRIKPGTVATLSCKSSYKLSVTNDPAYRTVTCLEDGLWDRRLFRCLPGNDDFTYLVSNMLLWFLEQSKD